MKDLLEKVLGDVINSATKIKECANNMSADSLNDIYGCDVYDTLYDLNESITDLKRSFDCPSEEETISEPTIFVKKGWITFI